MRIHRPLVAIESEPPFPTARNNGLASVKSGRPVMDRRALLTSLGAVALASPSRAQSAHPWSSPVIDMHFHMRRTPELNVAHQVGAGVTAANLLTRYDSGPAANALLAQNSRMFPCWFSSTDVTKPDAEQLLTQAV